MSKVKDLTWEIEQLYIEGHSARTISKILECPVEVVYGWIESNSVLDSEEFDSNETVNF